MERSSPNQSASLLATFTQLARDLGVSVQGPAVSRQCQQSREHRSFEEPDVHDRSKHVDIQYHYARELIRDGRIVLNYVATADNLLTKSLSRVRHLALSKGIGVL